MDYRLPQCSRTNSDRCLAAAAPDSSGRLTLPRSAPGIQCSRLSILDQEPAEKGLLTIPEPKVTRSRNHLSVHRGSLNAQARLGRSNSTRLIEISVVLLLGGNNLPDAGRGLGPNSNRPDKFCSGWPAARTTRYDRAHARLTPARSPE